MHQLPAFLIQTRQIIRLYEDMLKPVCEQYGLTSAEAAVINFLYNHPGMDTAADIVELRKLSKGCVSQAVESLIRKSLLCRRQDTTDRRRIHLFLMPAAEPVVREAERVWEQVYACLFQGFTEEEQALFAALHGRVVENLKAADGTRTRRREPETAAAE